MALALLATTCPAIAVQQLMLQIQLQMWFETHYSALLLLHPYVLKNLNVVNTAASDVHVHAVFLAVIIRRSDFVSLVL